jgi:hypothetical protein
LFLAEGDTRKSRSFGEWRGDFHIVIVFIEGIEIIVNIVAGIDVNVKVAWGFGTLIGRLVRSLVASLVIIGVDLDAFLGRGGGGGFGLCWDGWGDDSQIGERAEIILCGAGRIGVDGFSKLSAESLNGGGIGQSGEEVD